jgi:hypothetical protein
MVSAGLKKPSSSTRAALAAGLTRRLTVVHRNSVFVEFLLRLQTEQIDERTGVVPGVPTDE